MTPRKRSRKGGPAKGPEAPPSRAGSAIETVVVALRSAEKARPDESAPFWSPHAAVRSAIDQLFTDVPADTLEAIRMAASELSENVIKYGEPADEGPGRISFTRTAHDVEIRTTNRLTDPDQTVDLFERLQRIGDAEDLRDQFVERMSEIMNEPDQQPSTALGLLRVGYEGGFALSGSYANGTVTIVATRSLR